MSFYEKFSAEAGGIKIVLSYRHVLSGRKLAVEIVDLRERSSGRIPAYYQYFEPTRDRAYPVIRVVAAPGVGITLDGFPSRYSPSSSYPDVDIIRVQDPELVPIIGFDSKSQRLLQEYEVNRPDLAFRASDDPRDRTHLFAPVDFFSVIPMSNGVVLRHHFTRQDLIITVPVHTGDPDFLGDDAALSSDAKFMFQINRGGRLAELRSSRAGTSPIVEVVKTPAVRVEVARQPKNYSFTNPTGSSGSLNDVFFQIYETKKVADVPHPGELFTDVRSSWKRFNLGKVGLRQPIVVSKALTLVDMAVRFLPGLGDAIDIAEFANGLFTGRDLFGRKLSTSDLVFMGLGTLLPFAASTAMRHGGAFQKKFGRKAPEAAKLLDDLHLNKDEARLILEVEELVKKGANVPIAKLQDYVEVVKKVKSERPTIDVLLNVDQSGFVQAELQAAYRRYRQGVNNPVDPREWALRRTRDPEAIALLKGILGPDFAKQVKRLPTARVVNGFEVPRPADLTDEVADEILAILRKHPEKVTERLTHVLPDQLIGVDSKSLFKLEEFSTPAVTLGHFNILKGNIAEILSRDIKLRHLTEIQKTHKDAFIISGIRIQLMEGGTLKSQKLFTDDVIARMNGDNLELLKVYEVKAGYKGGQEAQEQIFDWIEGRLTDADGSKLIIAKGGELTYSRDVTLIMKKDASFLYDPGSKKTGRVIGLNSAGRVIITPKGVSHLGINSADQVATSVVREELKFTVGDIERAGKKVLKSAVKSRDIFIQQVPVVEQMTDVSSAMLDCLVAHLLGKLSFRFMRAMAQEDAGAAAR